MRENLKGFHIGVLDTVSEETTLRVTPDRVGHSSTGEVVTLTFPAIDRRTHSHGGLRPVSWNFTWSGRPRTQGEHRWSDYSREMAPERAFGLVFWSRQSQSKRRRIL
jgi:hypothetical protein